ncbi:MAG: hypothetical protein JEZ09_10640 [Salinivirgaceae bacterium]|nr:hypothetical protein [Salinivirgaceae bacterium]
MANFNSKILLFGEYTILRGAVGLAIPYSAYSGELILPNNESILSRKELDSNVVIKKLAIHLSHMEPFASNKHIDQFFEDALLGLHFNSNIPKNYGVGSSGAMVAAIYKLYFANEYAELNHSVYSQIKNELAAIESFFHGKSSGIDPLVSFLNKPTLINAPSNHLLYQFPENIKVFLIDSNVPSKTIGLVDLFMEKCKTQEKEIISLILENNRAIMSILELNLDAFKRIKSFCNLEQKLLPEMFENSSEIVELANQNVTNCCVKLCGSGDGGFLLCFAKSEYYHDISKLFDQKGYKTEAILNRTDDLISL